MKLIAKTMIRRGIEDGGVEVIAEGETFDAEKQQADRLVAYGAAEAKDAGAADVKAERAKPAAPQA